MCCESATGHRRSHHNNAWPEQSVTCCTRAAVSRDVVFIHGCRGTTTTAATTTTTITNSASTTASTRSRQFTSASTIAAGAAARILGLSFMLLLCCSRGLAIEPARHDVLDLMKGLQATSANPSTGLQYTQGENNDSRALWLQNTSRRLVLPASVTERVLEAVGKNQEITFLCLLRQDEGTSGTVLAIGTETRRFLEIESSGRRKELRFHFTHMTQPRTITFPYLLADGSWHRVALYLSGDSLALYVDCQRIYQRVIPSPDRTWRGSGTHAHGAGGGSGGSDDTLHLFLGQRNSQHALFRGALQDVKIVTQAHGYLLQCPESDTDCPTCAQFQALESQLRQMNSMYIQLKNQLSKAEVRITDLEQCECLHTCNDNGTQRKEGEEWKIDECNFCRCKDGRIECHHEQCPYLDCKNQVKVEGQCCPVCDGRCIYRGKHYEHAEEMSPRVCVTCRCEQGKMECSSMNITRDCPKLSCPKKINIHDKCCPVCEGTDFCSLGHTCHKDATCVNLDTMLKCVCNDGFDGDGHSCEDIDECKTEGGHFGNYCGKNTRCVNTPGSYRCDCLEGHSRVNSNECSDYAECSHQCHPDAQCVKVHATFQCVCRDGFDGDGHTCSPHCQAGCRNGGKCIRPNVCECRHGYLGPSCDLDIDECAISIAKCKGNSVCINKPGSYQCQCLAGYHSPLHDNHSGTLCRDVDECEGEGGGNTCHPSMACVNTDGSYECRCKDSGYCTRSCVAHGDDHPHGSRWISSEDKCEQCSCENGFTTCNQLTCNCSDPKVDLDCCPACDLTGTCRHQVQPIDYNSGDRWSHECQLCECRSGEIDCWPLECPALGCYNTIQDPGDCCPVCADSNQCGSTTLGTGGQDLSEAVCDYRGRTYGHGDIWRLEDDKCAECQCKGGQICCSVDQFCWEEKRRG